MKTPLQKMPRKEERCFYTSRSQRFEARNTCKTSCRCFRNKSQARPAGEEAATRTCCNSKAAWPGILSTGLSGARNPLYTGFLGGCESKFAAAIGGLQGDMENSDFFSVVGSAGGCFAALHRGTAALSADVGWKLRAVLRPKNEV